MVKRFMSAIFMEENWDKNYCKRSYITKLRNNKTKLKRQSIALRMRFRNSK